MGAVIAVMVLRLVSVLIPLYIAHDYFRCIRFSGLAWCLMIFISVAFVSWIKRYGKRRQTKRLGVCVRVMAYANILDAQAQLGISEHFNSGSFYTSPFTGIYPDGIGTYCQQPA